MLPLTAFEAGAALQALYRVLHCRVVESVLFTPARPQPATGSTCRTIMVEAGETQEQPFTEDEAHHTRVVGAVCSQMARAR